jgi:hypothetical protein
MDRVIQKTLNVKTPRNSYTHGYHKEIEFPLNLPGRRADAIIAYKDFVICDYTQSIFLVCRGGTEIIVADFDTLPKELLERANNLRDQDLYVVLIDNNLYGLTAEQILENTV